MVPCRVMAAARHELTQSAADRGGEGCDGSRGNGGPDLKPEVEAPVGRLFRWHIEPAPKGLWIDLIVKQGGPWPKMFRPRSSIISSVR